MSRAAAAELVAEYDHPSNRRTNQPTLILRFAEGQDPDGPVADHELRLADSRAASPKRFRGYVVLCGLAPSTLSTLKMLSASPADALEGVLETNASRPVASSVSGSMAPSRSSPTSALARSPASGSPGPLGSSAESQNPLLSGPLSRGRRVPPPEPRLRHFHGCTAPTGTGTEGLPDRRGWGGTESPGTKCTEEGACVLSGPGSSRPRGRASRERRICPALPLRGGSHGLS